MLLPLASRSLRRSHSCPALLTDIPALGIWGAALQRGCLTCEQSTCPLKSVNLLVDALRNSVEAHAGDYMPPELAKILPDFFSQTVQE